MHIGEDPLQSPPTYSYLEPQSIPLRALSLLLIWRHNCKDTITIICHLSLSLSRVTFDFFLEISFVHVLFSFVQVIIVPESLRDIK